MNNHSSYTVGSEQSLEAGLSQVPNTVTDPKVNSITTQVSTGEAQFYNGNTGQESSSNFGSHQASEGATIFSAKGSPKAFIDSPTDLVTFQGMPVQAKTLETMGILKLDPQGRYNFVEQANTPEQQQQQEANTDLHDSFAMSEAENASINSMIPEGVGAGMLQAITSRCVEGIITGDLAHTISALSSTSGQSPAEATATVNKVVDTFTNASNRYLANTVGMSADDTELFYEWAKVHSPVELKGAINTMVSTNNFKSLGKLVGNWCMANPPSEQALKAGGYKTGKSNTGELTVFIKGHEYSVKSASKARLI